MINRILFDQVKKKYGGSGTIFDRKDGYYHAQGHPYGTLRDEEVAWLAAAGYTTGTLNDRWTAYLRAQGLTGILADMIRAWIDLVISSVVEGRYFKAEYFHGSYFHGNYWATGA